MAFHGYSECIGHFKITDQNGHPLAGVDVSYRVGESGWIPCGSSVSDCRDGINFFQSSSIFYRIGEPVSWCFFKSGYEPKTVTRYTADKSFDERFNSVALRPLNESSFNAGETLLFEPGLSS